MMFKHNLQLFSLIVGGAIAFSAPVFNLPAFSQDANAQNCLQALDYNPATTTTRSVELEQFGIRITIPSTYRTMLHNDGTVGIYPPGSYLHLQCLAKGFEVLGTDVILGETLTLRSNPEDLTLDEFAAKRKEEFLKRENFIATAELSQQQIQGVLLRR